MHQTDSIQGFVFEDADIRGQIVHVHETLEEVLSPHAYPDKIKELLGEIILSTLLMSATIKFKGQLTVQFRSNKALNLLLVKCNHEFQIRALAQFDKTKKEDLLLESLKNGQLVVTIETDRLVKPYQSIVPINGSIQKSLEFYFTQSEQLPTRFWMSMKDGRASGMLLQQLPDKKGSTTEREEDWQNAITLGETLNSDELLSLDNETLLFRLYHENQLRLFDHQTVSFHCPCSRPRMLEAVKTMGQKESDNIFKLHKTIDVTCEFCLRRYAFDKMDVAYLFQNQ